MIQPDEIVAVLEQYRRNLLDISTRLDRLAHTEEAENVLMVADALGHTMAALSSSDGQIAPQFRGMAKEDPVLTAFVLLNLAIHNGTAQPWVIQARNILRWKKTMLPLGLPTLTSQDLLDLNTLRAALDKKTLTYLNQGDDEGQAANSNWTHRVDRAITVLTTYGAFDTRTFNDRPSIIERLGFATQPTSS